ncbi:hypothetical protein BN2497_10169 [Janthinobacterium sp. CG23_2]|nr:hypothetical protein BN2497_10169 [Janthinobacterium sp. CG23_2]CUU31482.1 hypothetical protein BN3177_10169 [Janthinobacterium sp. CG23_2]
MIRIKPGHRHQADHFCSVRLDWQENKSWFLGKKRHVRGCNCAFAYVDCV